MEKVLLVDEIKFPSTIKHTLDEPKSIFPFRTKNTTQFKGNFSIIISELARMITNYRLDLKKINSLEVKHLEEAQILSEFIANSDRLDFQNEVEKIDFIRFIDEYLFKGENIKIVHTYLYNFIGESKENQSVLRNTAEFIKDVFVAEDPKIEDIFKNKNTDHILISLIISEVEKLVKEKNSVKKDSYSNIFPNFTELFREDLKFLMNHKDYFIANFETLLNYYTFMYSIQVLLRFEKFSKANITNAEPLYFSLEWEAVQKKRYVASNLHGFKVVREYSDNLFAHEYTLRLLSYNIFNKGTSSKDIMDYKTLIETVESHGEDYTEQFKTDLKDLINLYGSWAKQNDFSIEFKDSIEELLIQLFTLVKSNMAEDARKKYGQSIEYLGQGTFLKNRGNLGYLLSMSYDVLILMTAVIVKDKRLPLKDLFEEFKKRGIQFDRQSIDEIVEVFNKNNILDKKSDSGDVQYVKPIL